MHGCLGCESWCSERVTEAETRSKGRYRSGKCSSTVSDGGSSVMDNRWCWRGESYTRCSEYRCGWGCKCGCCVVNDRWRWSGDCYTRCSEYRCGCECRCCMVNNRWRRSRHELLNMHGRWGCERWSGESVAEAETRSKHRYRSGKCSSTVSDGGSSVMDNRWSWRGKSYTRSSE
ncbi:hypothetical protein MTO96_022650 [Rhipicephalus appendiculatus]